MLMVFALRIRLPLLGITYGMTNPADQADIPHRFYNTGQ
jgi:hypothetical protein